MNKREEKIIEMLSEILGIEDIVDTITLDSNLVNDLGAESIDFIDICFQAEKIFKIGKVQATDIFPDGLKNDVEFSEGKLNKLIREYPYIYGELLDKIKSKKSYEPLLTVRAISSYVEWRLANAK